MKGGGFQFFGSIVGMDVDAHPDDSSRSVVYVKSGRAKVSVDADGADLEFNINKLFGGVDRCKSKFNFDFTCALFTASLYSIKNDVGMNLKRVGDMRLSKEFKDLLQGIAWGLLYFITVTVVMFWE
jgi:hypothetical protein